jgi:hypothetical protein
MAVPNPRPRSSHAKTPNRQLCRRGFEPNIVYRINETRTPAADAFLGLLPKYTAAYPQLTTPART